uniref:E3 ubiquitin-protein ligase HERC4 n=1 Tax=Aegilops tauschii subsp. strangulata TaxID=200361 RepID=A0A453FNW2_AEGTS
MCGDGSFGQLGTGDNQSRNLPFEATSFTTKHVEKLAFGMRHSLVLLKDNSVYGFGSARRGQVGKFASKNQKFYNTPRLIDGFPNCKIMNLYANGDHSAALDESGQLHIWGRALVGEHDDDQPRAAFPSLSISQVALGWHHALVLSGGELYAIGAYRHQKCDPTVSENAVARQLNLTTASSIHHEPSSASNLAKVPSIHGQQVTQIAAGTEHSALVTGKRPFIPESKNVRSAAAGLTAFCCFFCQRAERCSPGAGESTANWDWAILVIRWFLRE